jgi:hypothetical protein
MLTRSLSRSPQLLLTQTTIPQGSTCLVDPRKCLFAHGLSSENSEQLF